MTEAAAGLGMPTKCRLSVDAVVVVVCTLNRASRMAAALTYRNPAAHPRRSRGHSPHVNARIAGPRPNDTTSARESSSTPNADDEFVSRAKKPSRVARTIAKPMNSAAVSKSDRVEYTTHA